MTETVRGTGPRCPNHHCRLILTEEQKKQTSGNAPCEKSGAMFKWTQRIETQETEFETRVDKFGKTHQVPVHTFTIEGEDSVAE